ncbi:MAG: orotate phosphoribosyltransferase [Acidobacteria bacterium]|nr:orotate phosphoribosyltransferase [Acidobacteriota bacterium]MBI3656165.1 orotate phosphoribosyltransferase [Acidobacteriota bacterium]
MSQPYVLKLFTEVAAILDGHFLLSSGLHSEKYLQCARVLQYPGPAERLCADLAERFRQDGLVPDVILAPALGGILVAYAVASAMVRMGPYGHLRNLFAEREGGVLGLRRGFEIFPGERVIVVEDVITTGGSTRETITLARAHGGQVIAVGALVDRGACAAFDVPTHSLLRLDFRNFKPEECPQCRARNPLVKPGSRTPA